MIKLPENGGENLPAVPTAATNVPIIMTTAKNPEEKVAKWNKRKKELVEETVEEVHARLWSLGVRPRNEPKTPKKKPNARCHPIPRRTRNPDPVLNQKKKKKRNPRSPSRRKYAHLS
jgi:hypothetical protein